MNEEDEEVSVNSRVSLRSVTSKTPPRTNKVVPGSPALAPSALLRQLDAAATSTAVSSNGIVNQKQPDGGSVIEIPFDDDDGDDVASVVSDLSCTVTAEDSGRDRRYHHQQGSSNSSGSRDQSQSQRSRRSTVSVDWLQDALLICQSVFCPRMLIRCCFDNRLMLLLSSVLPWNELKKSSWIVMFHPTSCRSGLVLLMLGLCCAFVQTVHPHSPQYNPIVMTLLLVSIEFPLIPAGMRTFILLSVLTAGSLVLDLAYLLDRSVQGVTKILVTLTMATKLYALMEVLTYRNRASKARKFLYRRLRVFGVGFTELPYRLLRDIRYRVLALGIVAMVGTVAYFILFLVSITTSLSLDSIITSPTVGIPLSIFLLIKTFTAFAQVAWVLTDTDIVLLLGTFGLLGYYMKFYRAHVLRRREELGGWPLVYAFNTMRVQIFACIKTLDALFGIAGWVTLGTCTGTCFMTSPDNLQAFIVTLAVLLFFTDIWGCILLYYLLFLMKQLRIQRGSSSGGYDSGLEDSDNSELDELGLRDSSTSSANSNSLELGAASRRRTERRRRKLERVERRVEKQRIKMGKIRGSVVKRREKVASYRRHHHNRERTEVDESSNSDSSNSDSSDSSSDSSSSGNDIDEEGGGQSLLPSTHNPVHSRSSSKSGRRRDRGLSNKLASNNTSVSADARDSSRMSSNRNSSSPTLVDKRFASRAPRSEGSLMDEEDLPAYMKRQLQLQHQHQHQHQAVSPQSPSPAGSINYLDLAMRSSDINEDQDQEQTQGDERHGIDMGCLDTTNPLHQQQQQQQQQPAIALPIGAVTVAASSTGAASSTAMGFSNPLSVTARAPPVPIPTALPPPGRPVVTRLDFSALPRDSYSSLVAHEASRNNTSRGNSNGKKHHADSTHGSGKEVKEEEDSSSDDDDDDAPAVLVRTLTAPISSSARRPPPPLPPPLPLLSARGAAAAKDRLVLDVNTAPMEMERFGELWEAYTVAGQGSWKDVQVVVALLKDGVSPQNRVEGQKQEQGQEKQSIPNPDSSRDDHRIPLSLVMNHFRNIGVFVVAYADYKKKSKKSKKNVGRQKQQQPPPSSQQQQQQQTARLFSVTRGTLNGEEILFLLELQLVYDIDKDTSQCSYTYKCNHRPSVSMMLDNLRLKYIFK